MRTSKEDWASGEVNSKRRRGSSVANRLDAGMKKHGVSLYVPGGLRCETFVNHSN